MKVIKVGGGCLKNKKNIAQIVELMVRRGRGQVFVVSALGGVTDYLLAALPLAMRDESQIAGTISHLKAKHLNVARHLVADGNALRVFRRDLDKTLKRLERLLIGLNFTGEITPRLQDAISSYGERISAQLLCAIIRARKISATYHMPHKIGMLTDGKFGDATAKLVATARNFKEHLRPLLTKNRIVFVPGFFGVSAEGHVTTFGRGGSDYSAAVVATALAADQLEIWKDVEGFMSADPGMVPQARLIEVLSYEEAAELAYFGAKILHPRSVEPARTKKLTIAIKNTLHPDARGTLIQSRSPRVKQIIKSVAYDTQIAVLKVYASGVGARPGILAQVATGLTNHRINIRSVVTSQTCISVLLERKDAEAGRAALMALKPRPFRRVEVVGDSALICIVGDGLSRKQGIAARCFSAVADCGVNVEMISFGPSRAALYFLTKEKDLQRAVNAIHNTFFDVPGCLPRLKR